MCRNTNCASKVSTSSGLSPVEPVQRHQLPSSQFLNFGHSADD
jgi:hypothetical protein